MPGGKGNIKPKDGRQFSSKNQPPEKWTEKTSMELGDDLIDWLNAKDNEGNDKGNIFFEEFLIIERKLYPELISYLSEKFTSFFKLIEKAKKIQEIKLVKYGVGDRLNATMTKFVLTNHHGYKEKSENEQSGEIKINHSNIDLNKVDLDTLIKLRDSQKNEE